MFSPNMIWLHWRTYFDHTLTFSFILTLHIVCSMYCILCSVCFFFYMFRLICLDWLIPYLSLVLRKSTLNFVCPWAICGQMFLQTVITHKNNNQCHVINRDVFQTLFFFVLSHEKKMTSLNEMFLILMLFTAACCFQISFHYILMDQDFPLGTL